MASLTHVCKWNGSHWERTTAEKENKLHPGGKVSASSGLYMCELCGQSVTLTQRKKRRRHFKHIRGEDDKNCPERNNSSWADACYDYHKHELPIKINFSRGSYWFTLGFISVPEELFNLAMKVKIIPFGYSEDARCYGYERFGPDGITYLNIGKIPSKSYAVEVDGADDEIYKFWPKQVQGIVPEGTLFDKIKGKKLPYDADVKIGNTYYLVKKSKVNDIPKNIECRHILSGTDGWRIYEITARA